MKPRARYYLAAYEAVANVRYEPCPVCGRPNGNDNLHIWKFHPTYAHTEGVAYPAEWRVFNDIPGLRYELREQERRRRAWRDIGQALAVVAVCIAVAVLSLATGWRLPW